MPEGAESAWTSQETHHNSRDECRTSERLLDRQTPYYGNNRFVNEPKWYINGVCLINQDNINYLGTELGKSNTYSHASLRSGCSNKSFYTLQGASLYKNCLAPQTVLHVYNTAGHPGLLYGSEAIHMSKKSLNLLDKSQAKHVKTILGLSHSCHSTSLLHALSLKTISETVLQSSLDLFRSSILSTSVSSKLYKLMQQINKMFIPRTLVNRAQDCCEKHNVNFVKYVFYDDYVKCKKHNEFLNTT